MTPNELNSHIATLIGLVCILIRLVKMQTDRIDQLDKDFRRQFAEMKEQREQTLLELDVKLSRVDGEVIDITPPVQVIEHPLHHTSWI